MGVERIEFVGAAGYRLAGIVRRPDGEVRGSALIAHCFSCSKDLHTTARLATALTRDGWFTMTFDFTGLGESGGAFSATTVQTEVGDITRAAVALIERNAGPCALVGHSLGGSAAVLAAQRLRTVNKLVCIGSPADVGHVEHLISGGEQHEDGSASVLIGGRPFLIGAAFRDDLAAHDVEAAARDLDVAMLVVAAGDDQIVPAEQTSRLARAGAAETVTIPGADHLFTGPVYSAALAEAVASWLRQTNR